MSELENYVANTVNPLMEELVVVLLKDRPKDPVPTLLNFLRRKQSPSDSESVTKLLSVMRAPSVMLSEGEDDDGGLVSPLSNGVLSPSHSPTNVQKYMQRGARVSFSAVPTDDIMKKFSQTPTDAPPKSPEELAHVCQLLSVSRLGVGKSDDEVLEIASGFSKVVLEGRGSRVDIDGFVIVLDEGDLLLADGEGETLKHSGDVIGDSTLLGYPGCIQEATSLVAADDKTVFWRIPQEYLDYVTRASVIKYRERCLKFLSSVPIFASLDIEEVAKISEALRRQKFPAGSTIIKQGELGHEFFLVEHGECVATKSYAESDEPVEVMRYRNGDYMGELSLLFNEPRAANVVAVTDVEVLSLDRKSFKRLMGPIQDILMRNSQRYVHGHHSQ